MFPGGGLVHYSGLVTACVGVLIARARKVCGVNLDVHVCIHRHASSMAGWRPLLYG